MSRDPRRLSEYLPQYGFGTEVEFTKLVESNPFLFRVHSPKSPSHSDTLFPALKFDQRYTLHTGCPSSNPPSATYTDVVRHMDWTTRYSSPYISVSFSFMWAVWEAVRRYHFGVKHDIEIAVIDATAVPTDSVTVVEVLRTAPAAEQHANHWKWYHFAQESQLALIYGGIPQTAVLTSIPLLRILEKLPSYCLRLPLVELPQNQLDRLSPSFLMQKPSFRNFCVAQSAAFSCASAETRFRDSTSAVVHLALAFLGVWFHWMLGMHPPGDNDPSIFSDAAVTKLTELARIIALWPAAGETSKMWDTVIEEIAFLIAEEVQTHRRPPGAEVISQSSTSILDSPEIPNSDPQGECSGDIVPIWLDPRNFLPTPPPTPPPTLGPRHSLSANTEEDEVPECALRLPDLPSSPHDENDDVGMRPLASSHVLEATPAHVSPSSAEFPRPTVPSHDSEATLAHTSPALVELPSATDEASRTADENSEQTVVQNKPSVPVSPRTRVPRPPLHSMSDTASCLLTGFFFGALIILVLSTRRPALLYVS
ncbi:hypothetical protein MSAN_00965600 [Mycena sanguinolenta]|uniref:DUF7587 domain-containing protein n=1 Tax=Mycena sanguinolenta TaxID=230812 RepID=A0A8H7DBT4_9AGAR|nr:hypothetical protein MSAN_00965600 [Mycena sanguinolenta]